MSEHNEQWGHIGGLSATESNVLALRLNEYSWLCIVLEINKKDKSNTKYKVSPKLPPEFWSNSKLKKEFFLPSTTVNVYFTYQKYLFFWIKKLNK